MLSLADSNKSTLLSSCLIFSSFSSQFVLVAQSELLSSLFCQQSFAGTELVSMFYNITVTQSCNKGKFCSSLSIPSKRVASDELFLAMLGRHDVLLSLVTRLIGVSNVACQDGRSIWQHAESDRPIDYVQIHPHLRVL